MVLRWRASRAELRYKGTLMENWRLKHAARLAAKQHVLLVSPELGLDVQKWLTKTGVEFHWPGVPIHAPRHSFGETPEARGSRHQPVGPHCQTTRHLQDKWKADDKIIGGIQSLPGIKTWTEAIVKKIMQAKRRLKL